MKKIKNVIVALSLVLSINTAVAASEPSDSGKNMEQSTEQSEAQEQEKLRNPAEFQKIIDEYKTYVAKIPAKIRDEIIAYRKEIAKLNKEKKSLYKTLSQEGQNYLQKEKQYKDKLPLNRKKLITIEDKNETATDK